MGKINHPEYYNLAGQNECIEQMLRDYGPHITATFCLTNCYKYLYMAGFKGDYTDDIEKAKWYFNFLETRCASAVNAKGKRTLKLYLYVKEKLRGK